MPHIDLNRLVDALEPGLRVTLEDGASIAARQRHQAVDLTHWLRGIVAVDGYATLLASLSVPVARLTEEIDRALDDVPVGDTSGLALSQTILTLGREAFLLATLQSGPLLMLDLSLLQAGAGVKGEFERRLHGVIDAVKRSAAPIILFIDEAHGLVGAGAAVWPLSTGRTRVSGSWPRRLRTHTNSLRSNRLEWIRLPGSRVSPSWQRASVSG